MPLTLLGYGMLLTLLGCVATLGYCIKLLGSWVLGAAITLLDCGMLPRLLDYWVLGAADAARLL